MIAMDFLYLKFNEHVLMQSQFVLLWNRAFVC